MLPAKMPVKGGPAKAPPPRGRGRGAGLTPEMLVKSAPPSVATMSRLGSVLSVKTASGAGTPGVLPVQGHPSMLGSKGMLPPPASVSAATSREPSPMSVPVSAPRVSGRGAGRGFLPLTLSATPSLRSSSQGVSRSGSTLRSESQGQKLVRERSDKAMRRGSLGGNTITIDRDAIITADGAHFGADLRLREGAWEADEIGLHRFVNRRVTHVNGIEVHSPEEIIKAAQNAAVTALQFAEARKSGSTTPRVSITGSPALMGKVMPGLLANEFRAKAITVELGKDLRTHEEWGDGRRLPLTLPATKKRPTEEEAFQALVKEVLEELAKEDVEITLPQHDNVMFDVECYRLLDEFEKHVPFADAVDGRVYTLLDEAPHPPFYVSLATAEAAKTPDWAASTQPQPRRRTPSQTPSPTPSRSRLADIVSQYDDDRRSAIPTPQSSLALEDVADEDGGAGKAEEAMSDATGSPRAGTSASPASLGAGSLADADEVLQTIPQHHSVTPELGSTSVASVSPVRSPEPAAGQSEPDTPEPEPEQEPEPEAEPEAAGAPDGDIEDDVEVFSEMDAGASVRLPGETRSPSVTPCAEGEERSASCPQGLSEEGAAQGEEPAGVQPMYSPAVDPLATPTQTPVADPVQQPPLKPVSLDESPPEDLRRKGSAKDARRGRSGGRAKKGAQREGEREKGRAEEAPTDDAQLWDEFRERLQEQGCAVEEVYPCTASEILLLCEVQLGFTQLQAERVTKVWACERVKHKSDTLHSVAASPSSLSAQQAEVHGSKELVDPTTEHFAQVESVVLSTIVCKSVTSAEVVRIRQLIPSATVCGRYNAAREALDEDIRGKKMLYYAGPRLPPLTEITKEALHTEAARVGGLVFSTEAHIVGPSAAASTTKQLLLCEVLVGRVGPPQAAPPGDGAPPPETLTAGLRKEQVAARREGRPEVHSLTVEYPYSVDDPAAGPQAATQYVTADPARVLPRYVVYIKVRNSKRDGADESLPREERQLTTPATRGRDRATPARSNSRAGSRPRGRSSAARRQSRDGSAPRRRSFTPARDGRPLTRGDLEGEVAAAEARRHALQNQVCDAPHHAAAARQALGAAFGELRRALDAKEAALHRQLHRSLEAADAQRQAEMESLNAFITHAVRCIETGNLNRPPAPLRPAAPPMLHDVDVSGAIAGIDAITFPRGGAVSP